MAMTFVVHAQNDLHVPNILLSIANLDFDDLTVAAFAPPIDYMRADSAIGFLKFF